MQKRLIAFFLVILMSFYCACTAIDSSDTPKKNDDELEIAKPHTKEDGKAFRIGYVDYDEYAPASIQFYYIVLALEKYGWIKKGSIPFTLEDIDKKDLSTKEMYEELSSANLGDYIEFVPNAFWYLGYTDNEVVSQELRNAASGDLDMIFTFGTSAGVFVKNLTLSIPMVDFSATDPVTSGIIASSTSGTGNKYVWAQVEPEIAGRQLKYYYSIKPFEKLGVIAHANEVMSGIPDVYECAEELGFEVEYDFIEEQQRETDEQWEAYYALVAQRISAISEKDIDAFFLPVDVIWDTSRLESLLEPLYQKHIPVYLMDGADFVENGGLMLISANDMEGIGDFVAQAVIRILDGENAAEIPCIYQSAPAIYFNYDVADRIGYPLEYDFLASCDQIYSKESVKQ